MQESDEPSNTSKIHRLKSPKSQTKRKLAQFQQHNSPSTPEQEHLFQSKNRRLAFSPENNSSSKTRLSIFDEPAEQQSFQDDDDDAKNTSFTSVSSTVPAIHFDDEPAPQSMDVEQTYDIHPPSTPQRRPMQQFSPDFFSTPARATTFAASISPPDFKQQMSDDEDDVTSDYSEKQDDELPDLNYQSDVPSSTPPELSPCQSATPSQPPTIRITANPTFDLHVNPFSPNRPKYTNKHDVSLPIVNTTPAKVTENTSVVFDYARYQEDFVEIEQIGKGSFGSVTKCIHRLDGMTYAIKQSHQLIKGDSDLYV